MQEIKSTDKWIAIYESVQGASHVRGNLPNQDAVKVSLQDSTSLPAILAVADGHGSSKCFRSHVGSQFAVDVALTQLSEFAASIATLNVQEVRQAAEMRLPKLIISKWQKEVESYHNANPFTEEELKQLDASTAATIEYNSDQGTPYVAYGSTLVSVLLTKEFFLCLQLGDGDILVISDKPGQAAGGVETPLPSDEELIANETTSLCQPMDIAVKKVRFRFQYLVESAPVLVLITTDGYPNSFQTPEGFRQVAADFLNLLERDGVPAVRDSLKGWLTDASLQGSGDDVTLAMLYRETALRNCSEQLASNSEADPNASDSSDTKKPLSYFSLLYNRLSGLFERNPVIGIASLVAALLLAIYSIIVTSACRGPIL